MKKLMNYAAIAALLIAFFGASSLVAQEWSKEQKEVWKTIENMWEKWQMKDYDAAFANVHDKYLGWNEESPMPMTKAKWIDPMMKAKDFISKVDFDIEPARILVQGDVAVVHYYYEYSYLYSEADMKKMVNHNGKWAAFFIKEGGEWILLGDFTVREDDD